MSHLNDDTSARLRRTATKLRGIGRELTQGIDRRELGRLFDRDTAKALEVLTGESLSRGRETGARGVERYLRLTGKFFLGLALRLSPARRVLFAASLLCPLLGVLDLRLTAGPTSISVDASPFWFLVAMAGLVLLLALELVDRVRVRDELEVARELQREILPDSSPVLPGWRIAHSYRTANEIGGDYYDFLPLPDGRLAIAVGDASGHGMAAGLVMAVAAATLRVAAEADPSPPSVLEHLDRVLLRTGGRRAFLTLFYAVLDPASGRLELGLAGHPFPLLRRADGAVEELGQGSLPLGVRRDVVRDTAEATLAPGDLLVIYTDGIPETLGGGDEASAGAFGFDRLRAQVAQGGEPQRLHDALLAALDRHRGERRLEDDVTLVVLARS